MYGTGIELIGDDGSVSREGGVRWTIKSGVVFDAKELLADVRRMVEDQKRERGITTLPGIPWAIRN